MTTRRARLQIRPNTGLSIRDSTDTTARKTNLTKKPALKKNENSVNVIQNGIDKTTDLQTVECVEKTIDSFPKEQEQILLQKELNPIPKSPLIEKKVDINQQNQSLLPHNGTVHKPKDEILQNKNIEDITEQCEKSSVKSDFHDKELNSDKDISSKETSEVTPSKITTKTVENNEITNNTSPVKTSEKSVARRRLVRAQPNIREAGQRNSRQWKTSLNEVISEKKKSTKSKEHAVPNLGSPTSENNKISSPTKEITLATNTKQYISPQSTSPVASEKKNVNKSNDDEVSKKRNRYNKKPPERNQMTMMDLIYWNPPNNPMSQKKENKGLNTVTILQPIEEEDEEEEEVDDPQDMPSNENLEEQEIEQPSEESIPGPRVMVGPNGEITIDEDSLVIRRSNDKNTLTEVVQEVSECTYSSFRKQRPKHFWTDKETTKFYKALNVVGTDFSLMQNLFPNRTRQELKNKFKREERLNRKLVDRAMKDPQQFDLTGFDEDDDDGSNYSSEEEKSKRKCSKDLNPKTKVKKRKKDKSLDKGSLKEFLQNDEANIPKKRRKETAKQAGDSLSNSREDCKKTVEGEEMPEESEVIKSRLVENSTFCNSLSSETDLSKTTEEAEAQSGCRGGEGFVPDAIPENSKVSRLSPGQIVLLPVKTTNKEQVLHVYVVSPKHPFGSNSDRPPDKSCDSSEDKLQES
ncbi:transcription factor TFIIIB component B'' homolog [Centruroides vittatus]|uniref:transcription factor TFIIIB component B'' homolog n=1 Tax=Centruroides vittatus TaxID=120091 RepID=UPI00350F3BAE